MAAVFFGADSEQIAENVLLALKNLKFPATAYRFGRTWEKHDGAQLCSRFDHATHFVLIVDSDAARSRWLPFSLGIAFGRSMPVYFFLKSEHAVPRYAQHIVGFERVADLTAVFTSERKTFEAAEIVSSARKALRESGVLVTDESYAQCAVDGDINAVKNFLRAGFSPDTKDDRDVPIISLAIQNRHTSIVELLLAHGADVNASSDARKNTPLIEAAARCEVSIMARLLAEGARLDDRNNTGQTALMVAVGEGCTEAVELLLTHGADVTVVDQLGMTAMKYAALFRHERIREALESHR